MTENKELEYLLGKGYDPAVADGIRELQRKLEANDALYAAFLSVLNDFTAGRTAGMGEALDRLSALAEKYGVISEYGLHLLLVTNGLPYIHKVFAEKGMPDSVFYETMDDVRCKVNECVECKGEVGTFVAGWYDRFFYGACFAFGRFQYEKAAFGEDSFTLSCGKTLKKGDLFINMHIPSRGIPLTDEIRLASYRAAYEHYKRFFEDGIVIFGCHSWLLYDKHLEFLPEGMNIRKFVRDFELVYSVPTEEFGDIWRVFGRYAGLPYEELPRDTALRKAYAEWLCSGHKSGVGLGVFAFDGEKIVR